MQSGSGADELGPPSDIALVDEGGCYLIQVARLLLPVQEKKFQVLRTRIIRLCEPRSEGHAVAEVILPGAKEWVELPEPVYTGMLAASDQHELAVKKRKKWAPIYGDVRLLGSAVEPVGSKRSGSQIEEADSQGSKRTRTSSRLLDTNLAGDASNGVSLLSFS